MSVAIKVCFPLGRYHATPWDRAANAGEVEWPPAPWRILRALIATWHTRCPDIATGDVEQLIKALAAQHPTYALPRASVSQTRHYLPQGDARTDGGGKTVLTVDGQLVLDPKDALVVVWPDIDLNPQDQDILRQLVELLPYLGRAESICEATLLDLVPDFGTRSYARPADLSQVLRDGEEEVAVLVPERTVTVGHLERTTDQMRKAGRAVPEGARWIPYVRQTSKVTPPYGADVGAGTVHSVRWALVPPHPIRAEVGILEAESLRKHVLRRLGLDKKDMPAVHQQPLLTGHGLESDKQHQHAHWLFRPTKRDGRSVVSELMLWVPAGLSTDVATAVLGTTTLPRWTPAPKGYVPAHLELIEVTKDVDHQVRGPARTWTTATPVTTRRFPKGQRAYAEFWQRMIHRELMVRDLPDAQVHVLGSTLQQRTAAEAAREYLPQTSSENRARPQTGNPRTWRRYRWSEPMSEARQAAHIRLTFDEPVCGPLVLGDLAHFGLGLFLPDPGRN